MVTSYYNNANNEKTTLLQKSRKLVNECTVFQAEMLAIQEVAEILIINQTTGKETHIHSDSQAALKSLNKRKISNQTTLDTMNILNKLSKNNTVTNLLKRFIAQ